MSHSFFRVIYPLVAFLEWAMRFAGLDVFIQRDSSEMGIFNFERQKHGPGGTEYWGLGLNVSVSPLGYERRVIASRRTGA